MCRCISLEKNRFLLILHLDVTFMVCGDLSEHVWRRPRGQFIVTLKKMATQTASPTNDHNPAITAWSSCTPQIRLRAHNKKDTWPALVVYCTLCEHCPI